MAEIWAGALGVAIDATISSTISFAITTCATGAIALNVVATAKAAVYLGRQSHRSPSACGYSFTVGVTLRER